MLNNKRKYFYINSFIFLALFSKSNECIFQNKIILSCYLLNLTLIDNQTRQIWINLELYFLSYEFSNV